MNIRVEYHYLVWDNHQGGSGIVVFASKALRINNSAPLSGIHFDAQRELERVLLEESAWHDKPIITKVELL